MVIAALGCRETWLLLCNRCFDADGWLLMIIQPLFWISINTWAWSMFKAGSRQSKHSSYAWISPTLKIQACLLWVTTCDHIIRFFTWWTLKAMCAIHWCLSSPPRSSLPHLQFFNALLFASPWILVPSWSLMMFGHSKIVLLNHLKPKPYWKIAKFREMDLLKDIFKILPLFTDFSFETPFQCGWASKSKAGPNRSNSISSDATAVKLSDLVRFVETVAANFCWNFSERKVVARVLFAKFASPSFRLTRFEVNLFQCFSW